MEKSMTKQESYVERRLLFKNIWDTAMHIDEKDVDIMNKPRVINLQPLYLRENKSGHALSSNSSLLSASASRTLRMDEIDKCPIGKTKKQRIKNLRHVCNRILDFCDKQDADDVLYEQMASGNRDPQQETVEIKTKKLKKSRVKRIRKAKSMFSPRTEITVARATTSDAKDQLTPNPKIGAAKITSAINGKKTTFMPKATVNPVKPVKVKISPDTKIQGGIKSRNNHMDADSQPCRKATKKKRFKKKKVSIIA